jgi:hypothetical protein
MKQKADEKSRHSGQPKLILLCLILSVGTIMFFSFAPQRESDVSPGPFPGHKSFNIDSLESITAFKGVYKVLMSPRCMNCHPSGEAPLQGDDSHPHDMGVTRGEDGKGMYALKCANCHQPENTPGLHTPPGNPKWHLPPADMKMVFEGKTASELARQLLSTSENGGKNKEQLIEHITSDELVLGGWNPGEGRTLPPMSHAEFSKLFKTWIEKGAYTNID